MVVSFLSWLLCVPPWLIYIRLGLKEGNLAIRSSDMTFVQLGINLFIWMRSGNIRLLLLVCLLCDLIMQIFCYILYITVVYWIIGPKCWFLTPPPPLRSIHILDLTVPLTSGGVEFPTPWPWDWPCDLQC